MSEADKKLQGCMAVGNLIFLIIWAVVFGHLAINGHFDVIAFSVVLLLTFPGLTLQALSNKKIEEAYNRGKIDGLISRNEYFVSKPKKETKDITP